MRKLIALMFVFTIVLFTNPSSFAQTPEVKIKLTPPSKVLFDQEVSVVIEILDQDGKPTDEVVPRVTFSPSKFVENQVLYDCADESEFDNCKVNNRGVLGIYESSFTLVDSPVTLTVKAGSEEKKLKLEAEEKSDEAVASEETGGAEKADLEESTAPVQQENKQQVKTTVANADVTVGPTPSIFYFLLPLVLILMVVSIFVVRTTSEK